jgi:hypothetical protein
MYDFLKIEKKWDNKLQRNVYTPTFKIKSNIKDLIVRAGKFYAIFNYDTNLWETDDSKAIELIDRQTRDYVAEIESPALLNDPDHGPIIRLLSDQSNKLIREWHNFCEKDYRKEWDSKCQLNQHVLFSNSDIKREDYATDTLDYPLQETPTPAYDKICSTLYLPSEVEKWEWIVGCVLAGDQKKIQKMVIFYGEPGTGKSTIIDHVIANTIFGGYMKDGGHYVTSFDAENLCGKDGFGTDFLSKDAVICLDGDSKMDMITSKATLNKIISHEAVRVNGKYEKAYVTTPNCVLIVGSNEPIQLAPNSGMNRRVIDIRPTGNKLSPQEYDQCIEQLQFEKSGIAWKCLNTYKSLGRHKYDRYIAEDMLIRTSPFQNYVTDNYLVMKDGISLGNAYNLYKAYAEECNFKNILMRYKFRDTLKLYFKEYDSVNNRFIGFKPEKIGMKPEEEPKVEEIESDDWLKMSSQPSLLDKLYSHCPAQYDTGDDKHPLKYAWSKCTSTLGDLDTSKTHFVKVPIQLIVIDLDVKDGTSKSLEKNLEMARKFPPTYAEVSKSGGGIHLHYIYTGGDPEELSRIYDDNIEVKVFSGGSSLRRKLTVCNNVPIAEISTGLPLRGEKKGGNKVIDWKGFHNTNLLKAFIVNCLNKKHNPGYTRTEMNFLKQELDKWYASGETYDVRDFAQNIWTFAINSNNSKEYCEEVYHSLPLCSKDIDEQENFETEEYQNAPIVIFDCETTPSYRQAKEMGVKIPPWIPEDTPALFLINWKYIGDDATVVRMINPTPAEVADLFHYRLIGFNNRSYDNHMLWARSQGYTSEELFVLSQQLINKNTAMKARFSMAYNVSYTDIYDLASNAHRMSLKKWEIKLKVKHLEWNRPWDEPVPVKDWPKMAEYCDNDVITTELVFNECKGDYLARIMLAKLAGGTPNDTTNKLSTKFVKGNADKLKLRYTDFTTGKSYGDGVQFTLEPITLEDYERIWRDEMLQEPVNINHFPSYHWVLFPDGTLHNMYRGVDVGRGGLVLANPGMYGRAVTKDVASMHPTSMGELDIFDGEQTQRYLDIKKARIYIKHGDLEDVKKMFDGVLAPYLDDPELADSLSTALKLILNAFYGMTSSPSDYFEAKDSRNVNNIVALRGALVMKTLYDEVTARGFTVIHIKTDSIKIDNPTDEILQFVNDFGHKYGYDYEVEHTWEKICLKDDAQFIGRHDVDDPDYVKNPEKSEKKYPNRWEATGKYFAVPYVFKSLFTHQPIIIDDMAEIINVKEGALHLIYDEGLESEADIFIGRVGQFTPVKINGGKLYRVKDGKKYAAAGTKGYQWVETETVINQNLEDQIDKSYYISKCNDAIDVLKSFGDYEWFVGVSSDEPITVDNFMNYPDSTEAEAVPFN